MIKIDNGRYTVKDRFVWKMYSLFLTDFDEFLFLDEDNMLVRDPEYLFDYMEEKNVSALFWPDIWPFYEDNPVWKHFNGGPMN